MRNPIPSRARSVLTVVALLLSLILVVAALLFAVDRAFPDHTYTYQSYQLEVTPSAPWHPGQSLSLLWVARYAEMGPDAPLRSVTCHLRLYGPYTTHTDAKAVLSPDVDGGTLAASAPPLTLSTDLAAPAPAPVTYTLPAALARGYYVVVGFAEDAGGGGGSSSWVVEIAA